MGKDPGSYSHKGLEAAKDRSGLVICYSGSQNLGKHFIYYYQFIIKDVIKDTMNSQMKRYVGQGVGKGCGPSMSSLGVPPSQHRHLSTNLGAL